MKILNVFALAASILACTARADIPAPRPTVLTVTNLAAFPKFKFSYRVEGQPDSKPIAEGRPISAKRDLDLLVKSDDATAQTWEQIPYDWKGKTLAIRIEDVQQNGKTITVKFKNGTAKKNAMLSPASAPLFALTGIGACGLVLLRRRQREAA